MTVKEFSEKYNLKYLSQGEDREITGGFCGDLLSWVMANAREGHAWFSVMGNINAVAVASLNEVACLVLCQGSALNPDAAKRAEMEGINILSTDIDCFELAGKLYKDLKG